MKIVIHANPGIEWQGKWARYAVTGLHKHGLKAEITSSRVPVSCDIAILMGPNAWTACETSRPYIMFNRKFVGSNPADVHNYCAIGWDGFNGRGTFCVDEVDPTRLEKFLKPEEFLEWKKDGQHLLLCEQSNIGRATNVRSLDQYYKLVTTNPPFPVRFRRKPIGEENISYESFVKQIVGTKAVVSLNSTVSLDALLAGYPVISLDIGDPTYAITGHKLTEILYPNRIPLFQYLAHCQHHLRDVESGEFWTQLWPKRGNTLSEWK